MRKTVCSKQKMRLFIFKAIVRFFILALFVMFFSHLSRAQTPDVPGEEVVFKNGDVILNGHLVLPDSSENVPVLVFLGGLYEWGDVHPQRPVFIKEILLDVFPKSGIGVFFYDPRGTGESTGRWGRATMTDFAEDAKAAIHYLDQRREVDPQRIGIIGLGEEGWVAQIVAATAPELVKFVVSLGTSPFDASRQLVNEYHSQYVCNGEDSTTALQKAEQKALSHQNWVSWLPLTKSWRHMNNKRNFTPAPYLKEIQIPALFVFGENDGQVYTDWAEQAFQELFPGGLPDNFTVQNITGANHFFHVVEPCYEYPRESGETRLNFSFRFKEIFRNWIFKQL